MPENARTPLILGVATGLLGFLFILGGVGAGVVLMWVASLFILVGAIAWGVWLAIDQWERDRMEGRWSRIP